MSSITSVPTSSSAIPATSQRVVPQKRCRHCGETLEKAANNPRDRFCCVKCEESFYRTHCRVCEREIPAARNPRRCLCGRRKCAAAFRRSKDQFYSTRYPNAGSVIGQGKTPAKSNGFLPKNGGGTWTRRAGPEVSEPAFHCATLPLDPELVAHHARARKAAIAERDRQHPVPAPLIGPADPPVNIVGGYKFPNTPKIALGVAS
jgi:hypothetical protein